MPRRSSILGALVEELRDGDRGKHHSRLETVDLATSGQCQRCSPTRATVVPRRVSPK